ncbi:hypothetical protein MCOR07_009479 [Pyricularia oryzae]|nr:hypothetical protein MCOR26_001038 [Pyricularia oryzae]KAI6344473.1 hypothetical protein MCOR28_004222 [Pyricularia oryzae]KAI6376865.1 hypothetical protein MCOR31_001468 [Pyricularia oryzae]KAI6417296.1 hypothetical protein MCOR20_000477 [Pyricularia oryzae]KAI6431798.1 hypothetical protein MCOR24_001588 [Pyricularia oryzae]
MNQQGAQPAQAGASQPAGNASAGPMFRPEAMRTISILSAEDRDKYEQGLRQLWTVYEKEPEGSPAKLQAHKKIQNFGIVLTNKIRDTMRRNQQGQQPTQPGQQPGQQPQQQPTQQPQQQQQQAQPQQQQQQQAQPQQQPAQPQQTSPNMTRAPAPQQPAAGAQGGAPGAAGAPAAPNSGGAPAQVPAGANQVRIPDHIMAHINKMIWHVPNNVSEQDAPKWRDGSKRRYANALMQMEAAATTLKKIDQLYKERKEKNQPITPEEQKLFQERREKAQTTYRDTSRYVDGIRKAQAEMNTQRTAGAQPGNAQAGASAASPAGGQAASTPVPQTATPAAAPRPQQAQPQAQTQPQPVQQTQPQPVQQQPTQPTAQPGGLAMQNVQANINGAFEAAKNQQMTGMGRGQAPGALGQAAQPGPQAQAGANVAPAAGSPMVQQPPGPVGAQQPTIKPEPGTQQHQAQIQQQQFQQQQQQQQFQQQQQQQLQHQQHQGQMNTPITAAHTAGRVQTPQSGTPTTTTAPPPHAFSHAAAVSAITQRQNSGPIQTISQQQQAQQQSQRPNANGTVVNNAGTPTPMSAGGVMASAPPPNQIQQQHQQAHPQQQPNGTVIPTGHPHAHPGQQQIQQRESHTMVPRNPIAKSLPEKAQQTPQPVAMTGGLGPGRPTMTGGLSTPGGVMNQPVIARHPPGTIVTENDGDRVLSKKKLDELVRQVCGGTAEGLDGNLLTPEVEESVLTLADSFVDNVLHSACRNAKERGSKVLEIRDIQLVLERTYNIRIPGYSADELRTVRKVQPSAAWISKMSAVQAAKVMPGKDGL